MNFAHQDQITRPTAAAAAPGSIEATLHLVAHPPIPEGLEDRVRDRVRDRVSATLEAAPGQGKVLTWPSAAEPARLPDWMRAAAAAAIVFVVAGGGWGVYSRVEQVRPANVVVMPSRGAGSGAFSSAGAVRTPQSVKGPVLVHPGKAKGAQVNGKKKAAPRTSNPAFQTGQPDAAGNASPQPAVAPAR
jgi:hypothetical protein